MITPHGPLKRPERIAVKCSQNSLSYLNGNKGTVGIRIDLGGLIGGIVKTN